MLRWFADPWNNSYGILATTLWLFNIAMENDPFIEDFPIKTSIYRGFSMAILNNQMVDLVIPLVLWWYTFDMTFQSFHRAPVSMLKAGPPGNHSHFDQVPQPTQVTLPQ